MIAAKLNNPPVKVGDKIVTGFTHSGGEHWRDQTHIVRSVDSDGTPYVHFKFSKLDKPVALWRLAE